MNPNNPGNDPSYPGAPSNPPSSPQQPPTYPQQPPAPPQQPPAYNPQQMPTYPQQPPAYNPQQPQYPQQPQQPQYPQQQPPKKSKKGWLIGCGIAAAVLLLICGGIGVVAFIGAQRAGSALKATGQGALAATQVTLFCTDIQAQEYGSAYQLLSTNAQSRTSQSDFASRAAALDTSDGTVSTCMIDPNHTLPTISSDGKSATAQMQVARGDNANLVTGTVTLVYENDEWRIDSADDSLKLP